MNQHNESTSLWPPLRHAGYRKLFAGQTLSDVANWLDFLALSAIIVYTWGYGAFEMALLSLCIGLPWVVAGPLAGMFAGKLPVRTVLIACDLFRAAAVFAMLWADSLLWLLVLVALKMCASAIFDPLRQAAVKGLVAHGHLAQASSLSQMSVNATKIVAPMIGGALIAMGGAFSPFWAGGCLYLLSAAVLLGLPRWEKAAADRKSTRFTAEVKEALAFIRTRHTLAVGIVYMSAVMFLVFLYDGLFALFTEQLGMNEAALGILMSSVGAGSVAGSLAAGKWTFWRSRPLLLMSGLGMLSGLLIAVVGLGAYGVLPAALWLWVPFFVLLGASGAFSAVPFGYILQTETTERTVAPVAALSNALQTGTMLIAPFLGAALAGWIGIGGVFLSVGLLMCAFAAVIRMKMRRQAPAGSIFLDQSLG